MARCRVVFELDGPTLLQAEKWGELIVDACRNDPAVGAMELTEIEDLTRPRRVSDPYLSQEAQGDRR